MKTSTLSKGQFRLYDRAIPALKPGEYTVRASQTVGTASVTEIAAVEQSWTLSVEAPRLRLPPSEVLGVFPPSDARDCKNNQLPHILLSTRTLPWAYSLSAAPTIPWMGLLLFKINKEDPSKSEAKLVTDGTAATFGAGSSKKATDWLPGVKDDEPMAWVEVRKSILRKVLPLRDIELPLLSHVREVSPLDAEGANDDDGYVATVIGNRLPVDLNSDYLAVLVNFGPYLVDNSFWPTRTEADTAPASPSGTVVNNIDWAVLFPDLFPKGDPASILTTITNPVITRSTGTTVFGRLSGLDTFTTKASATKSTSVVDSSKIVMGADTSAALQSGAVMEIPANALVGVDSSLSSLFITDIIGKYNIDLSKLKIPVEPKYRIPVLHHWTFRTASDVVDFETLIKRIGDPSRYLAPADSKGGQKLFAQGETDRSSGHLLLQHKSREGEDGASFYRGPLTAEPIASGNLPKIGNDWVTADQMLSLLVGSDGVSRWDISYAAAFELGRLMAMARKDILQVLVDWRRLAHQEHLVGMMRDRLKDYQAINPKVDDFLRNGLMERVGLVELLVKDRFGGVVDPVPLEQRQVDPTGLMMFVGKAAVPSLVSDKLAVMKPGSRQLQSFVSGAVTDLTPGYEIGTGIFNSALEKGVGGSALDAAALDTLFGHLRNNF